MHFSSPKSNGNKLSFTHAAIAFAIAAFLILFLLIPVATVIYVAFTNSAHGQELATKWDERIATIRRTGKLQEILSRYGVPDWAK